MKKLVCSLCVVLPILAGATDLKPSPQVVVNQVHYDHVVWNGMPISVVVPVGQERVIKFPCSVSLQNTNPALTTDKVRIENNAGFLYITAKKAFSPIRLPIQLSSGQVVLMDLSASASSNDTPVAVVLPSAGGAGAKAAGTQPAFITYVSLLRYAIQHLYSPERLVHEDGAFSRTPMFTSRSVALVNQAAVLAMPLASWQAGAYTVTAVLLKNTTRHRVLLSPQTLHGSWLATSFYPSNYVNARGHLRDRTTVFVVSDQPFNQALQAARAYR